MGKRGDGVGKGGAGVGGVLGHGVGRTEGGRRRVGAITRGEGGGVVVEHVVRGVVRHVHGFCVIEVLRGDRLGERVVRRRSGVDGGERREVVIEIRSVEGVGGLVCGCGPKVHVGGGGGGGDGGGSGQRR